MFKPDETAEGRAVGDRPARTTRRPTRTPSRSSSIPSTDRAPRGRRHGRRQGRHSGERMRIADRRMSHRSHAPRRVRHGRTLPVEIGWARPSLGIPTRPHAHPGRPLVSPAARLATPGGHRRRRRRAVRPAAGQGRMSCPTSGSSRSRRRPGINFKHVNAARGREAPARDDGLGRGLPRLRRRRRPGPLPRQLDRLARQAKLDTARRRRPSTGTTARATSRTSPKEAGLDKTFFGMGVAVGDYDNDGDPDLYVTALGGGFLFRNDGKGHFEDVTAEANARGGRTAGSPAPRSSTWTTTATSTSSSAATSTGRRDRPTSRISSSAGRARGRPTTRRRPSTARSACSSATTAASSPTSANRRASRSVRPTSRPRCQVARRRPV